MAIEDFYNITATVTRLTPTGGNPDIVEYQAVGSFQGHIQQTDPTETALVGGVFGKTWRLWTYPDTDVKETDHITINGTEYTITGIKQYDTVAQAINPHLEIIITDDLS